LHWRCQSIRLEEASLVFGGFRLERLGIHADVGMLPLCRVLTAVEVPQILSG
jgi:hypothetical protein